MFILNVRAAVVATLVTFVLAGGSLAQVKPIDGSDSQRLDVMRQRLETIKRSLASAASVLREEGKDDPSRKADKSDLDTPVARLRALEKEAGKLQSDINSFRGKLDRAREVRSLGHHAVRISGGGRSEPR